MLRARLLAAAAVTALAAAPAAFAQDAPPAPTPTQPTTPPQTPAPATPAPLAPAPVAPAATAPTQAAPTAPTQTAAATPAQANTVIDVLKARGDFTTLLAALDRAGLTDTLKARPAISIFAPTDAAFAAMPEAERTRLLDPANAQELRQLLLYHVIVADVEDSQLEGRAGPVETAAGSKVQLDGTGEAIKADNAMVTEARLDASNGAVFAIDHVLDPGASQAAMGDDDAEDVTAPVAPPADAAPAPAPAATPAPTAPVAPPVDETVPPPASPPGATETVAPAAPGTTAPNGQPAATTVTTAAPPVHNPTDGQVDSQPDASRPTPPVQTPDPVDGTPDGDEPNTTTSPAPPRG
jgi:uncharacterized surface protein with fasciclin (FAS1) repeats